MKQECDQELISAFESISSSNFQTDNQRHAKSILNIQKGILQFNVEDKGLGQPFRVNLEQKSNKKIIFNNSHYNPIHNDTFFDNLQTQSHLELEKDIHDTIIDLDYEILTEQISHEGLQKELETTFTNIWVDEFNMSSKNPFSIGFKFDELTNELVDYNYEIIDQNYKNFSSEGYTGKIFSIGDKVSNVEDDDLSFKKQKYLPYGSKEQIEQDFLDLAKNIDSFCNEHYAKTLDHEERSNRAKQQRTKEVVKILGEEKKKVFDRVQDQINIAKGLDEYLFDSEKAIKDIKSAFETDVEKRNKTKLIFKDKDVSEIIEQANKRLVFHEGINETSQIEEEKPYTIHADPEKFFKEQRLKEVDVGEMIFQKNQWAIEDNQDVTTFQDRLPKERMAIQYPFELDTFQKRSVLRLEEGQNVFVCAHTSAGKTVVAEYSIALAKKNKRKAIYTSPIKALSNQKYRDFKEKFGDDVGIITGDVSLNPTASCLIVTTEVLRNMLYKGHDIVRDIAWVIFDEVHYVNNQDRGVVWEETIILLPESIGLVMLSATVPNHMDFANWVGRTKQRKIYVQKTLHRPVPLEHSIYYDGKIFVIKSSNEGFNQENYDKINKYIKEQDTSKKSVVNAKDKLKQEKKDKEIYKNTNLSQNAKAKQKQIQEKFIKKSNPTNKGGGSKGGNLTEAQQVKNLLKYCQKNELLPCVVFAFSKNTIKQLSESLGNLNLITHEESKEIEQFFNKAAHKLKPRDLEVHQIKTLKDLMMRGIAVHHSDVIPFIKEVVEILFSRGLIKVLFATETFAMGINMPTKTVIFYSLKKFDSQSLRVLNSSEYTQMSGRAGRRGLDLKGNVIILVSEPKRLPTKIELIKMLDHKGEMLSSKFKITYELIMKLLSSRELDVTEMMKKSYSENDKYSQLPVNLKRLQEVQKKLKEIQSISCPFKPLTMPEIPIEDYYAATQQMQEVNKAYWSTETKYLQEEFQLPSFCEFIDDNYNTFLGVIVQFVKKERYERYMIVLYGYEMRDNAVRPNFKQLGESSFFSDVRYQPQNISSQGKEYLYEIIELPSRMVSKIFDVGFDYKNINLKQNAYLNKAAHNVIFKMANTYQDYRKIRNGVKPQNIRNQDKFLDEYKQIGTESRPQDKKNYQANQDRFEKSLCYNCNQKTEHFKQIALKNSLTTEFDELMKVLDEDDLAQHKNFQARLNILRTLNYTDEENLPQLKARLAKEIENLYVAELIVQGIFDELDEAEIAGILICFVTQHKRKEEESAYCPVEDFHENKFGYSQRFIESYKNTLSILQATITIEMDNEVVIVNEIEEYQNEIFNTELMRVAYEWVKGKDFLHVTQLTGAQEGTIIRSMLRVDNLMKNIKNSAQYIGNNSLSLKIESCQTLMRRDIVFAQSLYLEEDSY